MKASTVLSGFGGSFSSLPILQEKEIQWSASPLPTKDSLPKGNGETTMLHPDIGKTGSPIEGEGLVAMKFIPKGTIVWKLNPNDKRVTAKELLELPKELHRVVYSYKSHTSVLTTNGFEYVNHSCDPTAWLIDDETLVASRDISPEEEVTFDYATADAHPWWRPSGSGSVRPRIAGGIITGRDCLDPAFQKRYRGHLPSWVLDFIKEQSGIRGRVIGWFAKLIEVIRKLKATLPTNIGR